MTNQKLAAILSVPALIALAVSARAQETPVTPPLDPPPGVGKDAAINPPPGAVVKSQGRFYIWGDAPFLKPQAPADGNANNPIPGPGEANTLNPTTAPSTEVMRGAIGYVLPDGSNLSPAGGSNTRVEVGAASAKASANLTPSANLPNPQFLNGWTLGGCTNCNASAIDYEGREVSVKAASDYHADQVTLTPSVSVFSSRSHQDFVQTNPGTATLDWNSTGAKVGLDSKVELNKELAVGVGGSYGVAKRDTTLTGAEGAAINTGTAPRIGNAEAKLTYKPLPDKPLADFSLNTFAGVNNYDSKAPGITTPSAGSIPTVKFSPSSDFYAGAGATYKFGTQ